MDKILLEARKRTEHGKQAAKLRAAGKLPAVTYGHGLKAQSLELDAKAAEQVYRQAGGNKIISLKIEGGGAKNVLIHDVQRDPQRGSLIHMDLYVVRMDEELEAEVPLHFVGESKAVYQEEGTLVKNLESISVRCLPGDLPESIEVDIAVLDDFEKVITVADLAVPKSVKFLVEDDDLLVAKIEPPRSEEEMAELEEGVGESVPDSVKEDQAVVSEQNEGNKDR